MSFDLAVLSVTKLCAILGFTEEWLRASLDGSLSLFERTLQRAVRDIEDETCLTRRRPFRLSASRVALRVDGTRRRVTGRDRR